MNRSNLKSEPGFLLGHLYIYIYYIILILMCFVGCNERIKISMLAAKPPRTLSRPKAVVMGKSWGARMAAEAMEGSLVTVS